MFLGDLRSQIWFDMKKFFGKFITLFYKHNFKLFEWRVTFLNYFKSAQQLIKFLASFSEMAL